MLSIACYVSQSYAPGASVAVPPNSARAAVRMNTADELGISCEGDCEAVYSKLPESVQPGVVTGQALVDLLDYAKASPARLDLSKGL